MPEFLQPARESKPARLTRTRPVTSSTHHAALNGSASVQALASLQRTANQSALALAEPTPPAQLVVQREASAEEKELLRTRLGDAYDNYQFVSQGDREMAVGLRDSYLLIRQRDRSYWRKYKLQNTGGRGFYGRLTDAPPTLSQIASAHEDVSALAASPVALFTRIAFSAGASLGDRGNNNRIMGQEILGALNPGGGLPASVYALRRDCEWLHMQGHGLGGQEVPGNLFAGSNGANSHMAAIEGAGQALRTVYGAGITVNVHLLTDEDYATDDVCRRIAAELRLNPDDVVRAMAGKASCMPELIQYKVLVNGREVWDENILPFQDGRFDERQFATLNERVRAAIVGSAPKPMAFVSGGTMAGTRPPDERKDGSGGGGGGGGGGARMDTSSTA